MNFGLWSQAAEPQDVGGGGGEGDESRYLAFGFAKTLCKWPHVPSSRQLRLNTHPGAAMEKHLEIPKHSTLNPKQTVKTLHIKPQSLQALGHNDLTLCRDLGFRV